MFREHSDIRNDDIRNLLIQILPNDTEITECKHSSNNNSELCVIRPNAYIS